MAPKSTSELIEAAKRNQIESAERAKTRRGRPANQDLAAHRFEMQNLDRQVNNLLRVEAEEREVTKVIRTGKTLTDGDGVEWWLDRTTNWWWWRDELGRWQDTGRRFTPLHKKRWGDDRQAAPDAWSQPSAKSGEQRASDATSDAPSRKSHPSSVSTALTLSAPLSLSFDEEMEARTMEKELAKIARLQERQAKGEVLTKYEKSAIRRKPEFDMAPVMLKLRAGAARLTLSLDEEKEAREVERELSDIASLQQRKTDGKHLTRAQEKKLGRKAEFENAPVMRKVRAGAIRPSLEKKEEVPAREFSPLPLPLPLPARLVRSEPLTAPASVLAPAAPAVAPAWMLAQLG